jgi:hypothetical protein
MEVQQMARPGLQKHPKFRRLVATLAVPVPHVVGYLECLWEVTYECGNPILGDVLDVELAAQWPGERGRLCEALMACGGEGRIGFIEQIDDGRYQVHDLFDHAPDYVLQRRNKEAERQIGKTCDQCSAAFRSTEAHARFCSDRCKSAFHRRPRADTRDTQRHAATRSDTDGDEALRVATRGDTQRHEPPAPARAPARAPAPTGEDPAAETKPTLRIRPDQPEGDEATALAQEFAFAGGEGNSPAAVERARAVMATLLRTLTPDEIRAEIDRPDRDRSEHVWAFRDRLIRKEDSNRGQRPHTPAPGDFDPSRKYPSPGGTECA